MRNFDFRKIDVEDFLQELGISQVSRKGNEVSFSCPFPGHKFGDKTPSASMRIPDTVYNCFSCGAKGNAVTFLADYEGVSILKARQLLRDRFGMNFREPQGGFLNEIEKRLERSEKRFRETPIVREDKMTVLSSTELEKREIEWDAVHEAWKKGLEGAFPLAYMFETRGFTPETLYEWEIGWDFISQSITIPIRDEDSNLVGFKGRFVNPTTKSRYKVLGGIEYGFSTCNVANILFGFPKAVQSDIFRSSAFLIVTEGEFNCISMHQKGWRNTVGLPGKILSERQADLLKRAARKVLFIFDDYEDGLRAANQTYKFIPTSVVPHHDKDPNDMTKEELDKLIYSAQSVVLL